MDARRWWTRVEARRAEALLDRTAPVIDAMAGDEGIDDPDTTMRERQLPSTADDRRGRAAAGVDLSRGFNPFA